MWDKILLSLKINFNEILVKFTYIVGMIADQNFYDICFTFFYPTASATAYGQRPKFIRAEHSATTEGENCAYGPTLPYFKHTCQDLLLNRQVELPIVLHIKTSPFWLPWHIPNYDQVSNLGYHFHSLFS